MLTRFLLLLPLLVFGAFMAWIFTLWVGLLALFLLFVFAVMANLYPEKLLLHFLQARETTESEFLLAHQVASNQSFKLRLTTPQIYTYNGFFHRAFALSARRRAIFVVERGILDHASKEELEALWFSMALQIKDRSAKSSTFALLGMAVCWVPYLKLMQLWRDPPIVMGWIGQFMVAPVANLLHHVGYGEAKCQKFLGHLAQFPHEESRLRELNGRLTQPRLYSSVARDLSFRASAAYHGPREQMILALESAAHPLDFLRPTAWVTPHA